MNRLAHVLCLPIFFALIGTGLSESTSISKRDAALNGINACMKRNEVSSRECRKLKENIATLEAAYRDGDKSVLPTLFHVTYSITFYQEALLADCEGFIDALSKLPEKDQQPVIDAIAGGIYDMDKARFEALRNSLAAVPESSQNYRISLICLNKLQSEHADLFLAYFPPQTFSGPAAPLKQHRYARLLSLFEEKPVWAPVSAETTIYRLSIHNSWGYSRVVRLSLRPDGTGEIVAKEEYPSVTKSEFTVSKDQVAAFQQQFNEANFWDMPTERQTLGSKQPHDGAHWLLEAVQNGKYHVVDRWCPGNTSFGDLGRALSKLADQKLGDC